MASQNGDDGDAIPNDGGGDGDGTSGDDGDGDASYDGGDAPSVWEALLPTLAPFPSSQAILAHFRQAAAARHMTSDSSLSQEPVLRPRRLRIALQMRARLKSFYPSYYPSLSTYAGTHALLHSRHISQRHLLL